MDVTTFDLHRLGSQDLNHKEEKGAVVILEIWETFTAQKKEVHLTSLRDNTGVQAQEESGRIHTGRELKKQTNNNNKHRSNGTGM